MMGGELAALAQRLVEARAPFVCATVVRARRPSSVRPGDAAIVLADGTIEGFVGGACAHSSVRLHALRVMETGEPLLLRLVPSAEESTAFSDPGEGGVVERNPCLSGGSLEIFLEPQLPAPRLIVIGGGAPVARALERISREAGYDVVGSGAQDVEVSAGAAAVIVASHGSGEETALAQALTAGVPYVALVASTIRGEAVRASLDVPDELRAQLHTPAGLNIGAMTPAEIAISILAEIVAERHANPARAGTGPGEAAGHTAARTSAPGDPPHAVDPMCGMQVAVAPATPNVVIAGERLFFCSDRCRDAYAEPNAGERDGAAG